jgi:hypothetical protein
MISDAVYIAIGHFAFVVFLCVVVATMLLFAKFSKTRDLKEGLICCAGFIFVGNVVNFITFYGNSLRAALISLGYIK